MHKKKKKKSQYIYGCIRIGSRQTSEKAKYNLVILFNSNKTYFPSLCTDVYKINEMLNKK